MLELWKYILSALLPVIVSTALEELDVFPILWVPYAIFTVDRGCNLATLNQSVSRRRIAG